MNDNTDSELEQKMVNQLAREFLQEQRSHRRWNIFFKCLLALYLFSFLIIYLVGEWELGSLGGGKHSARPHSSRARTNDKIITWEWS